MTILKNLFFCLCLGAGPICSTNCLGDEPFFPKLIVTGSGVLHKPSDQLNLNISVVTQGATAEKALGDNNEKMQAVITSLEKVGLKKGEYETGRFTITPTYSAQPKNPPPDWKPTINGFDVTNTLQIRTSQLKLAPQIIDAVSSAGANNINNIEFDLKDPQLYRNDIIALATSNAIADAKSLADAANLKLVRVLNITLEHGVHPAPIRAGAMMLAKVNVSTPIEAADVEITANVSITYEITTK